MKDELLVGVDIGTSYSRGVVTTIDGAVVARAERAHDVSMPNPGWAEHDAEVVWWGDLCAITRELTAEVGADRVRALARAAWARRSRRSTSATVHCGRPSSTASTPAPARRSRS